MMRRYCRKVGGAGEDFATKMLEETGYMIIERNYRTNMGEVDIIASKDGVLHFIEVKTRTSDEYGFPADAVDETKQKRIRNAARHYLANKKGSWSEVSFDVFEVMANHIEDCM